jgi:hypothetical protein
MGLSRCAAALDEQIIFLLLLNDKINDKLFETSSGTLRQRALMFAICRKDLPSRMAVTMKISQKIAKIFSRVALLFVVAAAFYTLSTPAQADSFQDNTPQARGRKPRPEPTPTPKPGPREGGADD